MAGPRSSAGRNSAGRNSAGSAGRIKGIVLTAGILLGALVIVSWSQTWFTVQLIPEGFADTRLEVGGDVAAGGLAGLGLAGLALVGALSIAGPVFRVVLGVLQGLIGATVVLSAATAIADPLRASAAAVTEVTGITGSDALPDLVEQVSTGFWPVAATVLGIAQVALGIVILATVRRFPGASRKFQPLVVEPESADSGGDDDPAAIPTDTVADWDALSDGADPTAR